MAATFKRSELMTLEALYIEREKPEINSKDEYKRRPLACDVLLRINSSPPDLTLDFGDAF